jgi:hypothetical protein
MKPTHVCTVTTPTKIRKVKVVRVVWHGKDGWFPLRDRADLRSVLVKMDKLFRTAYGAAMAEKALPRCRASRVGIQQPQWVLEIDSTESENGGRICRWVRR